MSASPGLELTCSALPSPCSTCSSFRLDQTPSGGQPRYNMFPLRITSMYQQQLLIILKCWVGNTKKRETVVCVCWVWPYLECVLLVGPGLLLLLPAHSVQLPVEGGQLLQQRGDPVCLGQGVQLCSPQPLLLRCLGLLQGALPHTSFSVFLLLRGRERENQRLKGRAGGHMSDAHVCHVISHHLMISVPLRFLFLLLFSSRGLESVLDEDERRWTTRSSPAGRSCAAAA